MGRIMRMTVGVNVLFVPTRIEKRRSQQGSEEARPFISMSDFKIGVDGQT
jgi:hypothetical protein